MSKKEGALQKDVPWRANPNGGKPIPKIHHSPLLRLQQNPNSTHPLAVMKHPDPIGKGFATEVTVEAAGPDCLVPGQITPIRLLSLKVWPIEINMKFTEPVDRELKNLGKVWPIEINMKFTEPVDRELKNLGKVWPIEINMKFTEPVDRELKNLGKRTEFLNLE